MLNNTTPLPSKPIHDPPKNRIIILQPTLRTLKRGPKRRNVLTRPNRRQDTPGRIGPVLGERIVILFPQLLAMAEAEHSEEEALEEVT
jgi:hypothetical protein